ncbi:MAG: Fur family transcriptional regulator [Candidatus Paceibacterota bacterium]
MKVREILKENKIRFTENREKILDLLIKVQSPISIKDINKKLGKSMDLTTIYRTLEKFTEKNLIYKTNFGDTENYFEHQKTHHHHITCKKCGEKEEVRTCIDKNLKEIKSNLKNFSYINNHVLEFFGTCKKCSK